MAVFTSMCVRKERSISRTSPKRKSGEVKT